MDEQQVAEAAAAAAAAAAAEAVADAQQAEQLAEAAITAEIASMDAQHAADMAGAALTEAEAARVEAWDARAAIERVAEECQQRISDLAAVWTAELERLRSEMVATAAALALSISDSSSADLTSSEQAPELVTVESGDDPALAERQAEATEQATVSRGWRERLGLAR
jgi:hypothetical protein